jgi:hypothetical protein
MESPDSENYIENPVDYIDFFITETNRTNKIMEFTLRNSDRVAITDYSERSFAVYGDTKSIKNKLMELGGKYNRNLRDGCGWIFSKKTRENVQKFLEQENQIALDKTIGKTAINQSDSEGDTLYVKKTPESRVNDGKTTDNKKVYIIYSDALDKIMGFYTNLSLAKVDAKKLHEPEESGIYLLEVDTNCIKELDIGKLKEISYL